MTNRYIWDANAGQIQVPATLIGFSNLIATRDPLVTDDVTQGYIVGSEWFNASAGALRSWTCISNVQGAAQWEYGGAVYSAGGTNPATELTQFGSGTASIAAEGNFYREVLPANAGRSPTVTGSGAFMVLAVITIPANSFDGAILPNGTVTSNRGINITAMGSLGANGNTKRIFFLANPPVTTLGGTFGGGGVLIADTAPITVNGGGWSLQAEIFKTGAAGSNTQLALHQQAQAGSTISPLLAPQNLTLTESIANVIVVGASCTTLGSDVTYDFAEANAMN